MARQPRNEEVVFSLKSDFETGARNNLQIGIASKIPELICEMLPAQKTHSSGNVPRSFATKLHHAAPASRSVCKLGSGGTTSLLSGWGSRRGKGGGGRGRGWIKHVNWQSFDSSPLLDGRMCCIVMQNDGHRAAGHRRPRPPSDWPGA